MTGWVNVYEAWYYVYRTLEMATEWDSRYRDLLRWAPSPRPNSGLPEFGPLNWPKSDKSDFGWERVGVRGSQSIEKSGPPHPGPLPFGAFGEREKRLPASGER